MGLAESVIDECKLELLYDEEHVDEMVAAIRQATHTGASDTAWIVVAEVISTIIVQ